MDKINFDLVGNNRDLIKKIEEAQSAFVSLGKTAEEQARRIEAAFDSISLESAKKSFTGISDNMPVVINSLKAAREQFDTFNAAGKGTGPVWKQALSSLGSWQTAVAAGITLLGIYGDKIVEWFQNLAKAPGYIDKAKIKQDVLNSSVKEYGDHLATAYSETGRQMTIISQLSTAWGKLGDDLSAKKKFINDNKDAFTQLGVEVNSVKDAENLLVKNTGNFIAAIKLRAKAAAGQSTLQSLYAEQQMLEDKVQMGRKVAAVRAKAPTADDAEEARRRNRQNMALSPSVMGGGPSVVTQQVTALDIANENAQQMLAGVNQNEARLKAVQNRINRQAQIMAKDFRQHDELMKKSGFKSLKTGLTGTTPEDKAREIREQQAKFEELLDEHARNARRKAQDRENLNVQAEIDAREEGADKKLAQLKFNQRKELQELEREREDLLYQKVRDAREAFNAQQDLEVKKNPNHKREVFDSSTVQLSVMEVKSFSEREANILAKQQKELDAYAAAEKAALNELLAQYGTYVEKRQAIIDRGEEKKKGKSAREQEIVDQQTKKSLADLQQEVEKETDVFGKLFTDMKNRSVKDVKAITERAEEALAFVKGGEWSEEQGIKLGVSKEAFDYLQKTPEEVEKIGKALTGASEGTEKLDSVFTRMGDGFEKVFNSGSDPKKLKEGLAGIEGAMNELMGAGKLLSNSFSSLGNAFGNDALKGIAEGMNVAMDAASATMDGAKAGAVFGPWGAAAGAAIGLATSLASSIAKIHDAKNEKRIKRLQEQIDTLERSYKKLGKAVDKAYSADASKLIGQQNEMLEQQKVLIQNQIKEEESKKNSDEGRIKEWQNQLEDIDAVIAENKEKAKDAIFGEDLKSAINEFAQAYADAWAAGDDKAKSSKDFVKSMIKQMIVEAIKAASSKPMEELRDKLNGFFSDGIISNWEREQIERDAEKIMRDLDRQFAWADQYMKGDEPEEKPAREASQQGIAQASQESVDRLDGVMTGIQGHTYSIDENVRAILSAMNGEGADFASSGTEKTVAGYEPKVVSLADIDKNMSSMIGLQNMAVSHLSKIERNTDRLEAIELSMGQIKNGIDTLNTKGITLKR